MKSGRDLKQQPSIHVTIIDDTRSKKCEGCCGLDLSSPGEIASTTELLKKLYGKGIRLEYLDLGNSSISNSHPEIAEMARLEKLPLLLINGKPRISGYFDLRLLKDAIQAEIEMNSEQ